MRRSFRFTLVLLSVWLTPFAGPGWTEEVERETSLGLTTTNINAAMESIQRRDLAKHVGALADDTMEGREAGTRGGRAAAGYIVRLLKSYGVQPAGDGGSYYQVFGPGYRNILAMLPGSDPTLAQQVVLVGAHYDHVGYGTATNSYGPTGYIHNGADDNGSGTSGLLELIQAFSQLSPRPKRSILFAFWDAEEKGLLGSKHWASDPTIPLSRVKLVLNMDMIGRLRDNKVEVYGTRSSYGLRSLVSQSNLENLILEYTWEMKENSDHFSFYERGIPVLMLHSGLHDDYHRPSDDAERLNTQGMQDLTRIQFRIINTWANAPEVSGFRSHSRSETTGGERLLERPLATPPGRLGVLWNPDAPIEEGLLLTQVVPGSAAANAGLKPGDRLLALNGERITSDSLFRSWILAANNPLQLTVQRASAEEQPAEVELKLAGAPVRVGVSWRIDDAEPGMAIVIRVVPGSAADLAGVKVGDRIYEVDGQRFYSNDELRDLLLNTVSPFDMLVERHGQLRRCNIDVIEAPVLEQKEEIAQP